MIVKFEKDYLRALYVDGVSTDKKFRFRSDVVRRYKRAVDYLKWASRKEDLFRINSLRFEALKGNKKGLHSIRVNDQYRIEFTITETEEDLLLTVCNIVELSKHYE